jgi:hypothetical protein
VTKLAPGPHPRRARRRRLVARRGIEADARLVSVAGSVGAHVHDATPKLVGLVDDIVVASFDETHPPVFGLIVRRPRGRTFVPADIVADVRQHAVLLSARLTHELAERPAGIVALAHDVLDRQIVDVDGANVVRVSDLVLGRDGGGFRLVGVDVSLRTLLRRLGPRSLRRRVAPERVYDWATVGAVSERGDSDADSMLHLTESAADLHHLAPADVEQLLADLPPHERSSLGTRIGRG